MGVRPKPIAKRQEEKGEDTQSQGFGNLNNLDHPTEENEFLQGPPGSITSEDDELIELIGRGFEWDDVVELLPDRSTVGYEHRFYQLRKIIGDRKMPWDDIAKRLPGRKKRGCEARYYRIRGDQ
jgi:hypothetical protein